MKNRPGETRALVWQSVYEDWTTLYLVPSPAYTARKLGMSRPNVAKVYSWLIEQGALDQPAGAKSYRLLQGPDKLFVRNSVFKVRRKPVLPLRPDPTKPHKPVGICTS